MKVMPREVKKKKPITWSREVREMQRSLILSSLQEDVLIGTLLGDGSLESNIYKKNYRLQVIQCDKQKEYVDWKYNIFRNLCLSKPSFLPQTNSWRFRTISHPILTRFRNLFYEGNIKIIPKQINETLKDPISLAVWFMDDGTLGPKLGLTLNTQNFTKEENYKLMKCLKDNFELKTSLHKDKNYWRIYILPVSVSRFEKIVGKFILPELKYKLFSF